MPLFLILTGCGDKKIIEPTPDAKITTTPEQNIPVEKTEAEKLDILYNILKKCSDITDEKECEEKKGCMPATEKIYDEDGYTDWKCLTEDEAKNGDYWINDSSDDEEQTTPDSDISN